MVNKRNPTPLVLAGLLLAAGCAMPTPSPVGQPSGLSPPPVGQASNLSEHSASYSPAPQSAPAAPDGAIVQVGYPQPWGAGVSAGPAACPAPGAAHPAGCGCGNHGASAYFTSGPWNQYGVDPQEFLCDGGDAPPAAAVRLDDAIIGVGLEDTVVKYTTQQGEIHVQPSNRVCLYAPRFAAVRKITGAVSEEHAIAAGGFEVPAGPTRVQLNQPSIAVTAQDGPERNVATRGPDAFRHRDRGVPVENIQQPLLANEYLEVLANLSIVQRGVLREADKPWISKAAAAAITWSLDTDVAVALGTVQPVDLIRNAAAEGLTIYEFPEAGRLRVCKLADKQNALPGDIVTFMIRVDNVGDSPVRDVVLTDNLTTRLEYIEGSQTCSAGAVFATEQNEGQSLRLTWTLTDTLKVGEGATIRFRCRVR